MSENTSKRRFWKSFTESPKKKKEKKKDDQASFFDHEDDELKEIRSLWTQIRPIHLNELKTKIILEGELEKKGKVMGKWKSRHYLLTQNYLIYQEVI